MTSITYRYFLAFLPDRALRCELTRLCRITGQLDKRIRPEHFHLTLCVIAEYGQRDRFIARRLDTFDGRLPASCLIWLGKVRGGRNGATVCTIGRQHEIQAFYRALIGLLAQLRIAPLHRKSGFRPHVTLGYDRSDVDPFHVLWGWVPGELVLIESEVGNGIHNVLRRWPLQPPPQGLLPFDSGLPLLLRRAA